MPEMGALATGTGEGGGAAPFLPTDLRPIVLRPAAYLVPAFLLFGWMLFGKDTIGIDYTIFPMQAALNLRIFSRLGVEPGWFPYLSGGFPIGGLVLGQAYHLPAFLLSKLPGYWTGHFNEWMTLKHLFLLAALHALFDWFLQDAIGLRGLESYGVSFVLTYNGHTLDMLRFGVALDASVYGYAVLLVGASYLLRPTLWKLGVLAAGVQFVLTAGYPPHWPYLALGGLAVVGVLGIQWRALPRFARLAFAASLGILFAAPNWMALLEYLSVNARRVQDSSLAWATYYGQAGIATFALDAVAPWAADVHAGVAGATLVPLLIGTLLACAALRLRSAWLVFVLLLFPFAYACGSASPVFLFFFKWVPGFGSIRVPGRVLVVFPLAILLSFYRLRTASLKEWSRALLLSGACNLGLLIAALPFAREIPALFAVRTPYVPVRLDPFWHLPGAFALEVGWIVLGIVSCLCALWDSGPRRVRCGILVVAAALQTAPLMWHGTFRGPRYASPSVEDFQKANALPLVADAPWARDNDLGEESYGLATIAYTRFVKNVGQASSCYFPIGKHPQVLLPFYLSSHVVSEKGPYAVLRKAGKASCGPRTPVLTYVVGDPRPAVESPDNQDLVPLNRNNRLTSFGPNGFVLAVDAPQDALLVTSYPNDTENWHTRMDGEEKGLVEVNGAFVGLEVPRGRHSLEVSYVSPALRRGYGIFALATWLGGLAIVTRLGRRRRALMALLVTIVCLVGYNRFERGLASESRILMTNNYPDLLQQQLVLWSAR